MSLTYSRNILLMVGEMHRRGYQRLRISPGMSPSGGHWRCAVTPASNILVANGAMAAEWGLAAVYSSSAADRYFGWEDAISSAPGDLARLFLARFPEICQAAYGPDWLYAGWYLDMLHRTYPAALPIAYSDSGVREGYLSTIGGGDAKIPAPPPGEFAAGR